MHTQNQEKATQPVLPQYSEKRLRLLQRGKILMFILLIAAPVVFLLVDYSNRIALAEQTVRNHASVYHDNALLLMRSMHSLMQVTAQEVIEHQDESLASGHMQTFVRNVAAQLPMIRSLLILDADGTVQVESRDDPVAVGMNLSDRAYFSVHRDQSDTALYLDDPVQSRVDGNWSLPMSIPVRDESGELLAVVVVSIEPANLLQDYMLNGHMQGETGMLLNGRGNTLTTIPYEADRINQSFPQPELFNRWLQRADSGIERTDSLRDQGVCILAYQYLVEYPVVATYCKPLSDVLSDFYLMVGIVTVITGLLIAGVELLSRYQVRQVHYFIEQAAMFRREVGERIRVERELQTAHDKLEDRVKARTRDLSIINQQLADEIATRRAVEDALKNSHLQLQTLLTIAPVPITVTRLTDGKHLYINPAAMRLFQMSENSPDEATAYYADASMRQQIISRLEESGNVEELEVAITTANGEMLWALLSCRTMNFDDEQAILTVLVDITEQRRAAAEIQQALVRERELNQMKGYFVSMVSHEFRTPLSLILNAASYLRRYADRTDEATRLRKLDAIERQVWQLTRYVEDISFINKQSVVPYQLRLETIDLIGMITRSIQETETAYGAEDTIHLNADQVCEDFTTDPTLLHRVLLNLLSNAVKYSQPDSHIDVICHCHNRVLTLQVRDNGIGIPEDDRARLFELFQRGSNVGSIAGTGVGLAIVQQSVDLLKGSITFETVVDEGTTFTLTLPNFPTTDISADDIS